MGFHGALAGTLDGIDERRCRQPLAAVLSADEFFRPHGPTALRWC
jgi:hypothetical protein